MRNFLICGAISFMFEQTKVSVCKSKPTNWNILPVFLCQKDIALHGMFKYDVPEFNGYDISIFLWS
jgi:hypothetical protein